ncbi:MAG: hypothetical protein HUN04_22305 [Desulfobacter sp.]|nr:MAG: hypothetical protein HUN04_22305 [Desulfobacter sp.]
MMEKNKIWFNVFIFAFICCINIIIASDSRAEGGWYKVKWGMTIDEVRVALKEDLSEPTQLKLEEYKFSGFTIEKYSFDVYMNFDSQKRLSKVLLRLDKTEPDQYKCFLFLENALKKKYGAPSLSKHRDTSKNLDDLNEKREWVTQDTLIVLNRLDMIICRKKFSGVNLTYQARSNTGESKL